MLSFLSVLLGGFSVGFALLEPLVHERVDELPGRSRLGSAFLRAGVEARTRG
jgi:hypothetical protein